MKAVHRIPPPAHTVSLKENIRLLAHLGYYYGKVTHARFWDSPLDALAPEGGLIREVVIS